MGSLYCDAVGRYLAFEPTFWLQWHITDRCPGACAHCYVDGQRRPDPSPAQVQQVFDRYVALLERLGRPGRLQLSGGEPLVAPHLWEILEAARRARIPARVLTGGWPVTPSLAARLRAAGVRVVQVSVEGDEASHDAIRGPGAYQRAARAVRLLHEAGIEVTVACTLHRGNPDALAAIRRDLGAYAHRIHGARLVPVGAGTQLAGQMLSSRQWLRAMRRARGAAAGARAAPELLAKDPTWVGFHIPPKQARNLALVGGCAAGFAGLTVDVDGTVYPCRRMPLPIGNAHADDLGVLLEQAPLMRRLRDRDGLQGACGRCDLRWLCGGCRAVAWAVHGDPMAPDPQCPWAPGPLRRLRRR